MAKQGMSRPDRNQTKHRNQQQPVPRIQGKAKSGKDKAKPIVAGTEGGDVKVWHEKPVSRAYPVLDTDLARDNVENDLTFADLQDL